MIDPENQAAGPRRRQRLVIRGRVQGVFYRASVCERARALGLAGWVRNRPDGAVEAVVEGPSGALETLAAYCLEGPPLARVTGITRTDEPTGQLSSFEVR